MPIGPPASVGLSAPPAELIRVNVISGLILIALIFGIALVTAITLAIGTAIIGSGSSSASSPLIGTRTDTDSGPGALVASVVQLAGMIVGGTLTIQSSGTSGGATLFFLPGFAALAVALAGYHVGRRRAQALASTRDALTAAGIAAVVPVLGLILVGLLIPIRSGPVSVAAAPAGLLFLGLPVLFCSVALGLMRTYPVVLERARALLASSVLRRTVAAMTGHLATTFALLVLLTFVYAVAKLGVVKTIGAVFLLPALGGNGLVLESALVHGGSLGAGAGAGVFQVGVSVDPFSSTIAPWGPLLLLVALVPTVVGGLRMGLGMPQPWRGQWRDCWHTPVAFLVVWFALFALVGRIALSGTVEGLPLIGSLSGQASVSASLASALILAVWGFLAEVVARILVVPVATRWPSAAVWLRVRAWSSPAPLTASPDSTPPRPLPVHRSGFEPVASGWSPTAGPSNPTPPAAGPDPAPGPRTAPPAAPALTTAQRRRLTIGTVIGGGVLVLLFAAAAVVQWLGSTYFGPRVVATQYLQALQSGNATAAGQLADPGIPNADRAGLTDDVLANATTRIDGIRTDEPTIKDDTATVPVEYSIDGKKVTASLSARRDGSTWLLFPTWRLVSSLATPTTVVSPSGVRVSGVDVVPAGREGSGPDTIYLYPGSYQVTGAAPGPSAKWFTFTTATAVVEGGQQNLGLLSRSVTVTQSASAALVDEVRNQVKALVDSCAASTSSNPTSTLGDCPFSTYASDSKASWRVTTYPQVDVDTNSYAGIRASTTSRGEVQVTTTNPGFFGSPATTSQYSSSFGVSATVAIADDGSVHLHG